MGGAEEAEEAFAGCADLIQIEPDGFLFQRGGFFLQEIAVADDGVERNPQCVVQLVDFEPTGQQAFRIEPATDNAD